MYALPRKKTTALMVFLDAKTDAAVGVKLLKRPENNLMALRLLNCF
jgi:hypothetical protein